MMNIKVFLQTSEHSSHLRHIRVCAVIGFGLLALGQTRICTVQQYFVVADVSLEKDTQRLFRIPHVI